MIININSTFQSFFAYITNDLLAEINPACGNLDVHSSVSVSKNVIKRNWKQSSELRFVS